MSKGGSFMLEKKAKELVKKMTIEEKVSLCSGKDCWTTKPIERLGLSSIMVSDGPHGLRKQIGATDNLGIGESESAVCFPSASAIACSFDRDLVYKVGKAIGEECIQEGVSLLLGPGCNQKRSPLCGRNFEYYSEDPVVSGELAASMIQGIQSTGTGASLKHFAVNNQEKRRMSVSAIVDERAFRETYLKAYEIAVKKGKPYTVMCSYNRINGVYSSENKRLLTDILRKEWGYEGLVISDWGAVMDRVAGIKAGLDLEMPGNNGFNDKKVLDAIKDGRITEDEIDQVAVRNVMLILRAMEHRKQGFHYSKEEHHCLAREAAEQSAVLLKNEGNILPVPLEKKAAVIGALAKTPRYQGAGSSKIHPIKVDTPWDSFLKYGADVTFAEGYRLKGKTGKVEQKKMIEEACSIAKGKEVVYIFAGLLEGYESEGFDRNDMALPEEQNELIEEVVKCNPNVIVVLMGGAPMELPWVNHVKGLLLSYLAGEGVGMAIVNLLLGYQVPSGKLAETWPLTVADNPSYAHFPGGRKSVEYRESIYVGYRYYEKAKKRVAFPFGYGLSYTTFEYSNLSLDKKEYSYGDRIKVQFDLKNCGTMAAKETAFLFVSHKSESVFLPEKELREFVKVKLKPGETKTVTVEISTKELGYYNTLIKDWYVESGTYQILIGSSLLSCPLMQAVRINSPKREAPDYAESASEYYVLKNEELVISKQAFEQLYGSKVVAGNEKAKPPFTELNTLEDVNHTLVGKLINKYADKIVKEVAKAEEGQEGMMAATIKEMPFIAMVASGEDLISETMMHGLLDLLNGHYIKGMKEVLK